jgi:hypothetical protein
MSAATHAASGPCPTKRSQDCARWRQGRWGGFQRGPASTTLPFRGLVDGEISVRHAADGIGSSMLQCRRAEEGLLLRRDEKYVAKHAAAAESVSASLESLRAASGLSGYDAGETSADGIVSSMPVYCRSFEQLVEAWRNRGLDHKGWLQGGFRETVHDLEDQLGRRTLDRATTAFTSLGALFEAPDTFTTEALESGLTQVTKAIEVSTDEAVTCAKPQPRFLVDPDDPIALDKLTLSDAGIGRGSTTVCSTSRSLCRESVSHPAYGCIAQAWAATSCPAAGSATCHAEYRSCRDARASRTKRWSAGSTATSTP